MSIDLVCKSYNGNYAFGLVGTYTACKGSCDAKNESCDAQGGTAGGSEFGSGSGGGSTDKHGIVEKSSIRSNKQSISTVRRMKEVIS